MIEKHLTLDRYLPGPDHKASAEPEEFSRLVTGIRAIEKALGDGIKQPRPSERNTSDVARRSIVAEVDISAGSIVTSSMVSFRRPGTGLSPAMLAQVTGRSTRCHISAGQLIAWDMLI